MKLVDLATGPDWIVWIVFGECPKVCVNLQTDVR